MYNIDSLKDGIKRAEANIKMFEDAIVKEYATISEYRKMIQMLEEKKRLAEEMKKNIVVEVEEEGD